MTSVVQRVTRASVAVDNKIVGKIAVGMVVLVAVCNDDTEADVQWTAGKLAGLRIFRNGEKHFDLDVTQIGGAMLLISNFTVAADARKGRRPSLDAAAGPELGRKLFDQLVQTLRDAGIEVQTGEFGANMQVDLTNDGPATFILNSVPAARA